MQIDALKNRLDRLRYFADQIPLLEYASLLFLAFPYFLFWAGMVRPSCALPGILLTGYGLFKAAAFYRRAHIVPAERSRLVPARTLFLVLILLLGWVLVSGAGGLFYQNGDYKKHNALFSDLVDFSWPPTYSSSHVPGKIYYLSYAIGYYLTPAFLGKFLPRNISYLSFYLVAATGVIISFSWFSRLSRASSVWAALFFILFGGLDIIGMAVTNPHLLYQYMPHLEWWAGFPIFQYSGNSTLLFWVPQHCLAGWIVTAMLMNLVSGKSQNKPPAVFVFSLAALWSPFVMLGLIPFLLLLVWRRGVKQIISIENIFSTLPMLFVVGCYFQGNAYSHEHGFLWDWYDTADIWRRYLFFVVLEFGVFLFIIYPHYRAIEKTMRDMLTIAAVSLLLIPIYRIGYFNDFVMRSSIPALFVLQVVLVLLWDRYSWKVRSLLISLIFLGSLTSRNEIMRGIEFREEHCRLDSHLQNGLKAQFAGQYYGSGESFFYRYLARRQEPQSALAEDVEAFLAKD